MVWLSASNIPFNRPSKKLDHKYLGPYEIVEKVGRSAYKLKTPGRSTRHATFNESLLKPHTQGQFPESKNHHLHLSSRMAVKNGKLIRLKTPGTTGTNYSIWYTSRDTMSQRILGNWKLI